MYNHCKCEIFMYNNIPCKYILQIILVQANEKYMVEIKII